jgi:hypothetical protein
MEDDELKFGPNGGLVFSMEFLMENTEWLEVGCHPPPLSFLKAPRICSADVSYLTIGKVVCLL